MDREGDTVNSLRLKFRNGPEVEMLTLSFETDALKVLLAQVDQINQFLGATSPPVQVVDERGPGPDPVEMEKRLQQLAEKHPRLAVWLQGLARWVARQRGAAQRS